MTPTQVAKRVAGINTHDDEGAHSEEDAIHRAVLEAIAQGARNPRKLAAEALKTKGLSFERWCA